TIVPNTASVTLAAHATQDTARFTITNVSTNTSSAITFSATPACSGVVSCSTNPTSFSLAEQGTYNLKVPYGVSASGTTGAVSVTVTGGAASASASQSIGTTPSYSLSIAPTDTTEAFQIGANGSFTIRVLNTSTNAGGTAIAVSLATTNCQAPVLSSCQVAGSPQNLAQGQTSSGLSVSFHAAANGSDTIGVTISGSYGIGSVTPVTG